MGRGPREKGRGVLVSAPGRVSEAAARWFAEREGSFAAELDALIGVGTVPVTDGGSKGGTPPETVTDSQIGPETPEAGEQTPGFTTTAAKLPRKAPPRRTPTEAEANRAQQRREVAERAVEALETDHMHFPPDGTARTAGNTARCVACGVTITLSNGMWFP